MKTIIFVYSQSLSCRTQMTIITNHFFSLITLLPVVCNAPDGRVSIFPVTVDTLDDSIHLLVESEHSQLGGKVLAQLRVPHHTPA